MKRAFTLVEIMISVALVLVLIIGVNRVFKITADTVGAGQTMSANVRDSRAAQTTFVNDFAFMAQPSPMFIIASGRVSAFRNRDDAAGDLDYAGVPTEESIRTLDMDNDNIEGEPGTPALPSPELISPATYNHRSHRTDRLGFFSRGVFTRTTDNDGGYGGSVNYREAWIWYGHLQMANNGGGFSANTYPGAGTNLTNPNNFYASQFALGRMAMLLEDEDLLRTTTYHHYVRNPIKPAPPIIPNTPRPPTMPNPTLTPLSAISRSDDNHTLISSRYDLAGATIREFEVDLRAVAMTESYWWQRMLYDGPYPINPAPPWTLANQPAEFRFHGNRFYSRPLSSADAALLSPILLDGCAQFIVEFAGDYVTQALTGAVTAATRDGIPDFTIDATTGVRAIRWYGMPRDVTGDGVINQAADVVPVRDLRGAVSVFERDVMVQVADYAAFAGTAPAMDPAARYTCVWGPDVPATDETPEMLRITYTIDEPAGRLAEGQSYEQIVKLR